MWVPYFLRTVNVRGYLASWCEPRRFTLLQPVTIPTGSAPNNQSPVQRYEFECQGLGNEPVLLQVLESSKTFGKLPGLMARVGKVGPANAVTLAVEETLRNVSLTVDSRVTQPSSLAPVWGRYTL